MQNKRAYFQGTEEPIPGKKQYKSDKAIVVQPRFKEPFFRNYDAYSTPGKHSPGGGWHNMQNYKSIADFLKARRQKLKDKYKADDSWIEDSKQNKEERIRKMKIRARFLSKLTKVAIDFPIDDQIGSGSIIGDGGSVSNSVYMGGLTDPYIPSNDLEEKRVDNLNFGRDYEGKPETFDDDELKALIDKYLNAKEPSIFGLPDGISPPEDLDPEATVNQKNPYFGTAVDNKITMYEDKWNI